MTIQQYREINNLSVAQFAQILGISRQHLFAIERHASYPSRKLANKIQAVTGGKVTVAELMTPPNE